MFFLGYVQVNRLIVACIAMIMLGRPSGSWLLCTKPMVLVGDISYSIYLIHWPVFKYYSYLYEDISEVNTHNLCSK